MNVATWRIDDDELARLIEHGESVRVEFKETPGGNAPERIREAVCAFANDLSRSGKAGIVAIGMKDDGAPSGIDIDDAMLRRLPISEATETSCRRPCFWSKSAATAARNWRS